jgi:hypothetical protein
MKAGHRGTGALALAWAFFISGPSGAVAVEASPEAAAESGTTRRVVAGRPEYDKSWYFKLHFGEGYRKLWTSPFEAAVLDLRTYAGGLTPVRQVGSMQSIGLALKGADGRAYTFRTLDKDPTKILPNGGTRSPRRSSRTRPRPATRAPPSSFLRWRKPRA